MLGGRSGAPSREPAMIDALIAAELSLIAKVVLLVALIAAGGSTLWSALWPEANFKAVTPTKPRTAPQARVSRCPALPSRLGPGGEMLRLDVVFEQARTQFQSVQTSTILARRQIDVAELALLRLVQEVAAVMPAAMSAATPRSGQRHRAETAVTAQARRPFARAA